MNKEINENDVKKAVQETIDEMNNKIEELSSCKQNDYNDSLLNDAINYIRNSIDNLKAYYEEVEIKFVDEDFKKNIQQQSRAIYNEANNIIANLPNYNEVKTIFNEKAKILEENETIREFINSKETIKVKDSISAGIDKLNNTTDSILYAARDLYDEYSEKEEVKKAINTIKETSKDALTSIKEIIDNNLKNKG